LVFKSCDEMNHGNYYKQDFLKNRMSKDVEGKTDSWKTREWTGDRYIYSTAEQCSYKTSWDDKICYDPISHTMHPCEREKCPLYYRPEEEK